jgi:hypothetical protein
MQSSLAPPSVFSYYIGLLRTDHTKSMLASALRRYGKILRLRLAKDKRSTKCKGYGYTTIELLCSEDKFISDCLFSEQPIYLKRIEGPKRLGAEHCSMLRRYAVFENEHATDNKHLLNKLMSFGAIELHLSQSSTAEKPTKYVLHILFLEQKTGGLLQTFLQQHKLDSICKATTFVGTEEVDFDQIVPPMFIMSHRFERSLLVEIGLPVNKMESNRQGFNRTTTSPKPPLKDTANLLPDTRDKNILSDTSAHLQNKSRKSKIHHSLEFRSFRKVACTINLNQLARYRLFLNASHGPNNIRLNVAAAGTPLVSQQLQKNLRFSAADNYVTVKL